MVTICDAVVAFSYLFFDRFGQKIGIILLPQHNLSNSVDDYVLLPFIQQYSFMVITLAARTSGRVHGKISIACAIQQQ